MERKKKIKTLFNFISAVIPLVIGYMILSSGIIVDYERSTGSELILLTGKGGVKKKGISYGVNYFEGAYTTYSFDTDFGFESIGKSFAFYKVIGARETEGSNNKRAAVLEINNFYPIWLILILIVLVLVLYLLLIKKKFKNSFRPDIQQNSNVID